MTVKKEMNSQKKLINLFSLFSRLGGKRREMEKTRVTRKENGSVRFVCFLVMRSSH